PLLDVVVLRAADRGRRDARAVSRGRVDREGPPARADLEETVARDELELAADRVALGELGLLERGAGMLEERARVGQARVKEERRAVRPRVGGVAFVRRAPVTRVAPRRVAPPRAPARARRGQTAARLEHLHVADGEADQRHEVGRGPEAVDVRLADAD